MIDDLDAKDALQVLWNPANNCLCHERAYPDGYEEIKGGHLGHAHIKDVQVDRPHAKLEVRKMGEDQFTLMAEALRRDEYLSPQKALPIQIALAAFQTATSAAQKYHQHICPK